MAGQARWVEEASARANVRVGRINSVNTKGGEHESRRFDDVWVGFPEDFQPERSLADGACSGEHCLTTAKERGATPFHGRSEKTRSIPHFQRRTTSSS